MLSRWRRRPTQTPGTAAMVVPVPADPGADITIVHMAAGADEVTAAMADTAAAAAVARIAVVAASAIAVATRAAIADAAAANRSAKPAATQVRSFTVEAVTAVIPNMENVTSRIIEVVRTITTTSATGLLRKTDK